MAESIPPRNISRNDSLKRQTDRSSLDTLLQMGFPKQRCLKALAATGDRGVQLASDWLLSHVNDAKIDNDTPREYVLYLCPVGALQVQLGAYWEKSQAIAGWNSAHNYFPHMTLCSFFKVEDKKLSAVTKAFETVEASLHQAPGKLQLELFSQKGFIGLMAVGPYYAYLEEVVSRFADRVKSAGITMDGLKKNLHITLAHQHPAEHHPKLEKLAGELDLNADVRWDFRLYSREPELANSEVYKVTKSYKPELGDELELFEGDYIFMNPGQNSADGWYSGTSWLTGINAMFPVVFTQRTAETWMWTLHRSHPLKEATKTAASNGAAAIDEGDYDNLWCNDDVYAKVVKKKKNQEATAMERKPGNVYVMRHGERCDFVFSRNWCEKCFDAKGVYTRTNLNLPRVMVKRKNYKDFQRDSPLTEMGKCQARITGEALREAGVELSYIYVSPALRCVQTATEVIRGGGYKCKLFVEPTIFEWCGWYKPSVPNWLHPDQLIENGFPVDPSYAPFISARNLNVNESVEEYYNRCASLTRHVHRKHGPDGGNILIVGHAGSLDACFRQLCGKGPRNSAEFHEILCQFPYCCFAMATEDASTKRWMLKEPPIPGVCHSGNKSFSWKVLQ
ncbi:ubiquitin-associated and SH3 domain-containing protein B-like [Littorina saxatilis]|uniref:UBA domain-containing protein n=1 Tax=Littorina saxatilis TaxID=31220 RepID=A0AAN9FXY3_9CAEN